MCDIECVFQSMTGRGSIFISNLAAAQNLPLLQAKGIQAVLSAARSGLLQHTKEAVPFYLYLPAEDHEEYAIERYFDQTFDFIQGARRQTNVLVHCMAGISRSVTIVIAYLIKKFKYSLEEVLHIMQRKRSKVNTYLKQVNPNRGFVEQLRKYALREGVRRSLKINFSQQKEKNQEQGNVDLGRGKMVEKDAVYILSNPLGKHHEEKVQRMKTLERTASTKEDISDFSKKSEELKQDHALRPCILNGEDIQDLEDKLEALKPLQTASIALRKRFSYDHRGDKPEKKLTVQEKASIQQKIIKVREKYGQKPPKTHRAGQIQTTSGKQDSLQQLRVMLATKKTSKPESEYLSLTTSPSLHPPQTILPQHQQLFIRFCETEAAQSCRTPSSRHL